MLFVFVCGQISAIVLASRTENSLGEAKKCDQGLESGFALESRFML